MRARTMVRNIFKANSNSKKENGQERPVLRGINTSLTSEDGSLCSTLTADNAVIHKPLEQQQPQQPRRSVHFDEEVIVICPTIVLSEQDCDNLWYSAEDYKLFKRSTTMIAKSLAAYAESCTEEQNPHHTILQTLYTACCFTKIETNRSPLTVQEAKHLITLFLDSNSGVTTRIGLERQSCRPIHKDKYARRIQLVHLIHEIQECAAAGLSGHDDVAEELRMECQHVTRPSRMFAQQIALAQAAAAQASD